MLNSELVIIFSRYQRAHAELMSCMAEVSKIALLEPQRTAFSQLQADEAMHALFIDSFVKPGSLPFYFTAGNPAAVGQLGITLPTRWEAEDDDENEND